MHRSQLTHLTILYTANIGGDLHLLPRLHTCLQKIKHEQKAPLLLLDLGAACVEEVWHCEVTGGRSTLIVLDGMGYHAANVEGFLASDQREKLLTSSTIGLVDKQHSWRYHVPPVRDEGIIVASAVTPALTLCIVAAQADETKIEQGTLWLQSVAKGQVGRVVVDISRLNITAQSIMDMPDNLQPDATIAATVEFVEDEARFFQQQSQ